MESFAGADLHKRVTQLAVLRCGHSHGVQPWCQTCLSLLTLLSDGHATPSPNPCTWAALPCDGAGK